MVKLEFIFPCSMFKVNVALLFLFNSFFYLIQSAASV